MTDVDLREPVEVRQDDLTFLNEGGESTGTGTEVPLISVVMNDNDEDEGSTTGWLSSSLLIVNAALGAGLLNFPQAFDQAGGVIVATTVQFLLMLFIVPALVVLAYCSDFNKAKTLQEVLYHTWGKQGQLLTSACIAIYCFGTCITFIIIIGDQFDRVFASLYGRTFCEVWYMNRTFTMLSTSLLFIFPFCFPKKIHFLRHVSSVGVVAVVYVVLLIIAQYYKIGSSAAGPIKTAPDVWTDVFLVVPVICFAYQCHVSIIPIYSCMKDRNIGQFCSAAAMAIGICLFTYTVAATFGYLTFGSNVRSDVLESYDPDDPTVLIAIAAIAIKTYATYPILLFCGREAVVSLLVEFSTRFGIRQWEEKPRRYCVAALWFAATLLLAVLLPNIGVVIKLLGSLAALFIFIFPGFCLLRISELRDSIFFCCAAMMFLIVGTFVFGVVMTQGIIFLLNQSEHKDIPLCTPQFK